MVQDKDCGVGTSADMPHQVWVVIRERNSNPFDSIPIGVFCNKRYAQFWIKNQPEDKKRGFQYFVYESLGNPEVSESIPEQRRL